MNRDNIRIRLDNKYLKRGIRHYPSVFFRKKAFIGNSRKSSKWNTG